MTHCYQTIPDTFVKLYWYLERRMSEQENSGYNRGKHTLRELERTVMRPPVGENAISPFLSSGTKRKTTDHLMQ